MKKQIIAALALAMVFLFSATALAQSPSDHRPGEGKRFEMRDKGFPGAHRHGHDKCPREIRDMKERFALENAMLLQKIREGNHRLMLMRQKAKNGELSAGELAHLEKIREIEKGLMIQKKAVKELCRALGENPKPKELNKAKEQLKQIQKAQLELLKKLLSELDKIA
ncbi:MAG: hypothetical protein FWE85_01980 [Clostridiales bacterium]|nr:hypothetical protein [Clostridiales bacterium]